MADDLHSRLLAAISAREERARAATAGPWDANVYGLHMDGSGQVRLGPLGRPGVVMSTFRNLADAHFIAAEDPSAVLRQTTRDRRVLKRHAICRGERDGTHGGEPWCHACNLRQPCPEIVDAAVANDVDLALATQEAEPFDTGAPEHLALASPYRESAGVVVCAKCGEYWPCPYIADLAAVDLPELPGEGS